MPVERRDSRQQVVAVLIGVVVVVVVVAAAWGLIALASGGDGPVKVQLGDDVFDAGQAQRIADQIAQDGPILYSDVSGRGQIRPIVVNHFGDDPKAQWVAFTAIAPGADAGCFVAWNAQEELFEERRTDEETGTVTDEVCRSIRYAANGDAGEGAPELEQYPWRIDKEGNLIVDLRPGDDRRGDDRRGDD